MRRSFLLPWVLSGFVHALVAAESASGSAAPAPAPAAEQAPEPALPDGLYAVIETPRGAITCELFPDDAPLTVASFVGLAEGAVAFVAPGRAAGKPFFDGLVFHRVVPGFVIQGGDPLGTGEGGPGYEFADEFTPRRRNDAAGMLAMANGGPGTNGSQFFITLGAHDRLTYMHTVFGRVVRGADVPARIQPNDPMTRVRIERVGAQAQAYRVEGPAFERRRLAAKSIPARDAAAPALFVNDAGLALPEWQPAWQNHKLHHYAATTGRPVFVRLVPKFAVLPAGADGTNPLPQLFRTLAGAAAKDTTLLLFVADENRWRIWFGDDVVRRLGVDPATLEAEDGRKALHAVKERVAGPARAAWDPAKPARAVDTAITQLLALLDAPPAAPVPVPAAAAPAAIPAP